MPSCNLAVKTLPMKERSFNFDKKKTFWRDNLSGFFQHQFSIFLAWYEPPLKFLDALVIKHLQALFSILFNSCQIISICQIMIKCSGNASSFVVFGRWNTFEKPIQYWQMPFEIYMLPMKRLITLMKKRISFSSSKYSNVSLGVFFTGPAFNLGFPCFNFFFGKD